MIRSLRPNVVTTARQLALLGGTCLLLLACASNDSTVTAAAGAAPAVVMPTPVPTTAPLSLPPADASLPALAALPAEPALAAAAAPAATAEPVAPSALEAPVETATSVAEADPAAITDASPVESATAEQSVDAPTDQAWGTLSLVSSDRWSDCLVLAAESAQATDLLDPISAGTTTDMNSAQLNSLAAASVGCDIVSTGLAATDIGDYVPTAAACMHAWLESSGGGSVFVGLASTSWGQSTPVWAQAHYVDALDSCFTGASFAADIMSVVSADSSVAGAFDASCLATSFDSSGTLRSFAQALSNDPATAIIPVSLSDGWVLNCANVGQMVAVAAAADGVALSGSTVSCIDSELKGAGVVAGLVAGTADTDAVGIATVACLTDAEAIALLG